MHLAFMVWKLTFVIINVCKLQLWSFFAHMIYKCKIVILGFALRSTPSLHHHFIIYPVLFILCLFEVKRATSSNHSSCIYHPFTYRNINLFCVSHVQCCAAQRTFRYFELCSLCLREGLGRSKPATNPWNKHNNTTVGISTISKPYWTVFYRINWALQGWVS